MNGGEWLEQEPCNQCPALEHDQHNIIITVIALDLGGVTILNSNALIHPALIH